ncbi:M1 family metallopeptidase [Tardisphaera saccharovorans]
MGYPTYELLLDIDWKGAKYRGSERITLDRERGLNLNVVGMKVLKVEVDGRSASFSHSNGVLRIDDPGSEFHVEFERDIPESLMGFYKAPYEGGYVFTTHFEPNGARTMFPCEDVPAKKARFRLSVLVDEGLDVISNMPQLSEEKQESKKLVRFQETPPMSTYLLYLGIGKFDSIEDHWNGKKIYVSSYGGKSKQGVFAIDVAKRALSVYEDYFGIPYELPKLHLIAVPEFAMGAMENWGAITFRDTSLLADEKVAQTTLRRIATTVVHELAHQWFGDLVTMKWWDDLWLNESFATYLSYKVVDRIFPEWEIWTDFLISETDGSLMVDSLSATHPIHVEVKSEDEIEQLFDNISYGKGASVLRMIEKYMGEESFRKGLSNFLRKYSYSNAGSEDLWRSLEDASDKPISRVVPDWVKKAGHPVIKVRFDGSVSITQEGFRFLGNWKEAWPIPLTYYEGAKQESLLMGEEARLNLARPYKLNADGAGYYRVLYEDWDGALQACRSAYDRWNVFSDLYAQLLQGNVSLRQYLDYVNSYGDRAEYLLSFELSSQLANLYAIAPNAVRTWSAAYHSKQVSYWEKKGPNGDNLMAYLSRRLAMVDEVYGKRLARMDYFEVSPDLRTAAAVARALYERDAFAELSQLYDSASQEDKVKLLSGMMVIRDKSQFGQALEFLLSPRVRRQDVTQLIGAASNVYNREMAWRWFKDNFDKLRRIYASSGVLPIIISEFIPYVGLGNEDDVEAFFASNSVPEASMGIKVGLELLRVYSRFAQRARGRGFIAV